MQILKIELVQVISIHAPAKGATQQLIGWFELPFISIHAPAKGATRLVTLWQTV